MKTKFFIYTAIAVVLFGCSEKKGESTEYASTELSKDIVADTTAIAKIIKTADMRFRVKDVLSAKEQLGAAVKTMGGTVMEAATNSYVEKTEKIKYSADSLKEITSYNTQGVLIARVPSEKIDDLTNNIAKLALFVDNQSLKLDDQSINYLQNSLKASNRADALNKLNKLATKKGHNVETGLSIKDDYVDKQVENMKIDNNVKYSTITLNFYQNNTIKTMMVANDDLSDYRPNFFRRLGLNIAGGWNMFKEVLLFLSNLWVFILLIAGSYFIIRYYRRKGKTTIS